MEMDDQFSNEPAHTAGVRKEMAKHDGKEKGRLDKGTSHADRPAKQRTARDSTGINPDRVESVTSGPTIPPA